MKAIAAVDRNWGIGKDGDLLVSLPGDLKYFKERTMGKVLIMGRRTLESLPGGKPLPGRTTIVLSGKDDYEPSCFKDGGKEALDAEGRRLFIAHSFDEVMMTLLMLEASDGIDLEEDVFVAGGESIYEMFMPYCSEFYITKIDAEFPADRHIEDLDELAAGGLLRAVSLGEEQEENGIRYRFAKYERV